MLFPALIAAPALAGFLCVGFALMESNSTHRLIYFGFSFQLWIFAVVISIWGTLKRLATDWPAGLMFAAGKEAGYRSAARESRRGRLEAVRNLPDDRLPPRSFREEDLL